MGVGKYEDEHALYSLASSAKRCLPILTPMLVSMSWKAQDMRQPTVLLMTAMQCTFRSCDLYINFISPAGSTIYKYKYKYKM